MSTEVDDLNELLGKLDQRAEGIPYSRLYPLSDLAGDKLTEFGLVWDALPTVQRRRLTRVLAELAEASYEVNFDAIFRHCMDDPDDQVRAHAIEGLWENEDVALSGRLLSMLRADPSAQVRSSAAAGLGRFVLAGELEQLDPLIQARIVTELLTTIHLAEEDAEVRRRALESVSYSCIPEVLDALEVAYYDEDELVRISAIAGMGRSCDRRWTDTILAELASADPAMRYEAALACGELELRRAVPSLSELIDDADQQVREATISALGQIGGQQARAILLAAYNGADADTRAALDDALAEQAFVEADAEFMLYEWDEDDEETLEEDDFFVLWGNDEDQDNGDDPDLDR